MTSDLRELHRELLEQVALAEGRWRSSPLTAFAALRGAEDSGALMVVGRAVNGWTPEWHAQEAVDADAQDRIVEAAFAPAGWCDGRPMLWVSRRWGGDRGLQHAKVSLLAGHPVHSGTARGRGHPRNHMAILHLVEQPVQGLSSRGRESVVHAR